MKDVFTALAKALLQLGDGKVLGVLVKTLAFTLVIIAGLGVALYYGLIRAGMSWGFAIDSSGQLEAALALILTLLAGWFAFRLIALAVLQFFADEIVAAVEAKHFPDLALLAKPLPFKKDLANSLRGIGRTLGVNLLALPVAVVLLVTGIGPAILFIAVNGWLLGRELTDMTWLRHCGERATYNPVSPHQRLMLGLVIAGIMLFPFLGLLAPVIGAAAGCHLTHAAIRQNEIDWLDKEDSIA